MQRQSGTPAAPPGARTPRPFSLDGLIDRRLPRPLTRLVQPPLERLLALHRLDRWYAEMPASRGDTDFLARVLERFRVGYRVTGGGLEAIPRTGPLVVVANHPFGGIEGMLMALMLRSVRDDVRIMANGLLRRIPELRELFIGVDPFGGPGARRRNLHPLREGLKTLQAGGCLVIFPAGEVSHVDLRRRVVTDPPWSDHAAKLARRAGAPVLPVYFHGANSWLFQALGLAHPNLRTALLPRELVNKCRKTLTVSVGRPIEPARLAAFGDDAA
ncbi:MAG: lysophospholipid acyltransferase family protein, partial [Gammaproteobacteria bacterium]|nr:lysophospholipid acyltransferase family protein [Gammaproteobacteria bacterium]